MFTYVLSIFVLLSVVILCVVGIWGFVLLVRALFLRTEKRLHDLEEEKLYKKYLTTKHHTNEERYQQRLKDYERQHQDDKEQTREDILSIKTLKPKGFWTGLIMKRQLPTLLRLANILRIAEKEGRPIGRWEAIVKSRSEEPGKAKSQTRSL